MASKKITSKKKVDAGNASSKTAKKSQAKKKEEGFIASGDMDRIISLGGGEWAYLLDPRDGKTYHIRVGSEKWNELIEILVLDTKYGDRIQKQLISLGWNQSQ